MNNTIEAQSFLTPSTTSIRNIRPTKFYAGGHEVKYLLQGEVGDGAT